MAAGVGCGDFLWDKVGSHMIFGIRYVWMTLSNRGVVAYQPAGYIARTLNDDNAGTRVLGVALAVLVVYIVGVFVGKPAGADDVAGVGSGGDEGAADPGDLPGSQASHRLFAEREQRAVSVEQGGGR